MAERGDDLISRIEQARLTAVAHPDDVVASYRLALAYARVGATAEARRIAEDASLRDRFDAGPGDASFKLWEDIGCILPRLAKDDALAKSDPGERRAALREAASDYERVARRTGGAYPLINAATLYRLGGDRDRATTLAAETLALMDARAGDFWSAATAAEAHLLLGDGAAARTHLEDGFAKGAPSYDDAATTLRQLRRIADEDLGGDGAPWLAELAPPPVAHFAGRLIGPPGGGARLNIAAEADIATLLRREMEAAGRPGPWRAQPFAAAYGALAAGADILAAEWLLEVGAPLHVVLPFEPDLFLETSVRPYGQGWIGRFRACLDEAADIRVAAEGESAADPVLFAYGSRFAMGLAALHARRLGTEAIQIALTDGGESDRAFGTDHDSDVWSSSGRRRVAVAPPESALNPKTETPAAKSPREVRSILFADVKGFSGLPDVRVPAFTKCVFGAVAEALAPHRETGALLEANTWGDALFAVFRDETAAADVALDLVSVVPAASAGIEGLKAPLSIRVGGHLGPVFEEWNAVLERNGAVGAHVSRGARVEPVAPVGAVWITEHFAAALELSSPGAFSCEFIGRSELAKGYGALCVYRLTK